MNSTLIDHAAAMQFANDLLKASPSRKDFSRVILDEYTIERSRCFVFFYESSRFLETKRFEDRLVGNAPILIDRESGAVQYLGTAFPVEKYIEEYEANQKHS